MPPWGGGYDTRVISLCACLWGDDEPALIRLPPSLIAGLLHPPLRDRVCTHPRFAFVFSAPSFFNGGVTQRGGDGIDRTLLDLLHAEREEPVYLCSPSAH